MELTAGLYRGLVGGLAACVMTLGSGTAAWASDVNVLTLDLLGSENLLYLSQEHIGPASAPNRMDVTISGNGNGGDGLGWARPLAGVGLLSTEPGLAGLQPGRLEQIGSGNSMSLRVTGDNNLFSMIQHGDGNSIRGTITGYGNAVAVVQLGQGNSAGFSQNGHGNSITIVQR